MSHTIHPKAWWELHVRKARGETLSDEEQRLYDAEVARQDGEAVPLKSDLGSLRNLREQARALAQANPELRDRLAELDREIRSAERSLSRETRAALGIAE